VRPKTLKKGTAPPDNGGRGTERRRGQLLDDRIHSAKLSLKRGKDLYGVRTERRFAWPDTVLALVGTSCNTGSGRRQKDVGTTTLSTQEGSCFISCASREHADLNRKQGQGPAFKLRNWSRCVDHKRIPCPASVVPTSDRRGGVGGEKKPAATPGMKNRREPSISEEQVPVRKKGLGTSRRIRKQDGKG